MELDLLNLIIKLVSHVIFIFQQYCKLYPAQSN